MVKNKTENTSKESEEKIISEEEQVDITTAGEGEKEVAEENEDKEEEVVVEKTTEELQKEEIEILTFEVSSLRDQNLRKTAEFDNYRRRTSKEKVELIKNAGEPIFRDLLPLIDNFERAKDSMDKTDEIKAVKEGIDLIYKEFTNFLSKEGIKEIIAVGKDFDTDLHEAITKIPAPTKKLKGKIVDVIKKGYTLNDKVIRFSQVIIGE